MSPNVVSESFVSICSTDIKESAIKMESSTDWTVLLSVVLLLLVIQLCKSKKY